MIIVTGICIVTGILCFVVSYLIWKKQKFNLVAGYTEGSVRKEDQKRFSKMNV